MALLLVALMLLGVLPMSALAAGEDGAETNPDYWVIDPNQPNVLLKTLGWHIRPLFSKMYGVFVREIVPL